MNDGLLYADDEIIVTVDANLLVVTDTLSKLVV